MRTLTITLVTAFIVLLALQLTAASRGFDREEHGTSQAVVQGSIACNSSEASFDVGGGLGVLAIPIPHPDASRFNVFVRHAEDCSDLLPAVAEQIPHQTCEIGNTAEDSDVELFGFVCAGRADAVISAIGAMAKAVLGFQL